MEWSGKGGMPCNGIGGEELRSAYPGSMPAVYLRSARGFSSACLRNYGTGDLYGVREGRRKLPVGCLQGRKARLYSRKKIVNLLLIRKLTEN